jgi:two-component system response regulator HydG
MVALGDAIRRAARIDASVVIWGPTGSGKEVVARAIHSLSAASERAFLPVNVAVLPEGLIESELFGVVRGAFTGAIADRAGLFEAAGGGTVFLDEAADLAHTVQRKLLRVLEYGEVRRVGATRSALVGFRLLVATQESPESLKSTGRWREDLYYRLAGLVLRVPSLCEHRSDIPELVEAFLDLRGLPRIERGALDVLAAHDWPGNVRELQQALQRAAFFSDGARLQAEHVWQALSSCGSVSSGAEQPLEEGSSSASFERAQLLRACAESGWDLRRAATVLGWSRATVYRRLRAEGVVVRRERQSHRLKCR